MADLLATLHAEAFPPAERWTAQAMGLLLGLSGHFGLVAESDGQPLGFALGRALMEALMAEAASRGAEALFLEVSEANGPARSLYAALGAVEVGRRRRYYPDGTDALVLRLDITSCGAAKAE